jgi:hypothetical protein
MMAWATSVRSSPPVVLDHLQTSFLVVLLPVSTLSGIPVAPGRYFASSAELTSAQDCFGRLA